jgi:predicted DNA-binding antitoxin AbrB/MazE fold protein
MEAIFEDGVLRPLEPLSLPEHQRLVVTIDTGVAPAAKPYNDRKAESAWLAAHREEYRGQWGLRSMATG